MSEPPLAYSFVAAADIRVQSPRGRVEAEVEAEKRGAKLERQRILSIIKAPEARYRLKTALHIALKTEMSVDEARDLLIILGTGTA